MGKSVDLSAGEWAFAGNRGRPWPYKDFAPAEQGLAPIFLEGYSMYLLKIVRP
jgi:hypothetical protein